MLNLLLLTCLIVLDCQLAPQDCTASTFETLAAFRFWRMHVQVVEPQLQAYMTAAQRGEAISRVQSLQAIVEPIAKAHPRHLSPLENKVTLCTWNNLHA